MVEITHIPKLALTDSRHYYFRQMLNLRPCSPNDLTSPGIRVRWNRIKSAFVNGKLLFINATQICSRLILTSLLLTPA